MTGPPYDFAPRPRDTVPGIGWAYTGVIVGGLASIAANLAHTYVPPPELPHGVTADTWRPDPGSLVAAIFWPCVIFLVIEIATRSPWPDTIPFRVLRYGGLSAVGVFAFAVSYGHMNGLFRHWHEPVGIARVGPLAVDLLMVMSTAAVFGAQKIRRELRRVALTTPPSAIDFSGHPEDHVVTMPVPPSARPKHRERHTGTASVKPASPPPAPPPPPGGGDGPTVAIPPPARTVSETERQAELRNRNARIFTDAFPGKTPLDAVTDELPKDLLEKLSERYGISPRQIRRAVQAHKETALANVDELLTGVELSPRSEQEEQ